MTLLIHVTITTMALPFAAQSRRVLSLLGDHPLGAHALDKHGGAYLLDVVYAMGQDGWFLQFAASLTIAMVAVFLVSPVLFTIWCTALHESQSIGRAVRKGTRHWGRAILVSLVLYPVGLLCIGLVMGIAWLTHLVMSNSLNAKLHDLTVCAVIAIGSLLLAGWATVHDLARANLIHGVDGPLRSVGRALRALSPARLFAYIGLWSIGLALLALAHWLGRVWDQPGLGWTFATVLAVQGIALFRTYVRSAWLAVAVEAVRPESECPALRAVGSTLHSR